MIVIATPTRDTVHAGFAYDLAQLIRYSPDSVFTISQGSILPNLRTLLVKTTIENRATHILFIDSDMRFPPHTLERLKRLNFDIVGANCKQRQKDEWTARKDGQFIDSNDKQGSEQVDTIGFGVTLIDTQVFLKLPQPWFSMPWDGSKHVGEDVYFCELARQNGFKIWIDHPLSREIKHIGVKEYGYSSPNS